MIDLRTIAEQCFAVTLVDGTVIHVQQPTVDGFECLQILYKKAQLYKEAFKKGEIKELEDLMKVTNELCGELSKVFSNNREGIKLSVEIFKQKFTYSGLVSTLGEYIAWTKKVADDPN